MKNTARNKQIVFFAESRKTVKLKLFLEKAKKGYLGEFLDILVRKFLFNNHFIIHINEILHMRKIEIS